MRKVAIACIGVAVLVLVIFEPWQKELAEHELQAAADRRLDSLKSEYDLTSVRMRTLISRPAEPDRLYIYAGPGGCEVHISVSRNGVADPAGIASACKKRGF